MNVSARIHRPPMTHRSKKSGLLLPQGQRWWLWTNIRRDLDRTLFRGCVARTLLFFVHLPRCFDQPAVKIRRSNFQVSHLFTLAARRSRLMWWSAGLRVEGWRTDMVLPSAQ